MTLTGDSRHLAPPVKGQKSYQQEAGDIIQYSNNPYQAEFVIISVAG
jgi:hypothetical protein